MVQVSAGTNLKVAYVDVSCRVLIDDADYKGTVDGRGYSYYGVSDKGVMVVVRPDGYVGTIAPLDGAAELDAYFGQFMKI